MFPQLWSETKDLAPEVFFGLSEVPPYGRITMPEDHVIEDLVDAIRQFVWTSNSSGYVEKDGIRFHREICDQVMVDLSRPFVFVSQPATVRGAHPTAWQILRFLQEPVRQVLFVGSTAAIHVRKTRGTMDLCVVFDKLWADAVPATEMGIAVEDEAKREGLLAGLMKLYEMEYFGEASVMWHFWKTFAQYLMVNKLRLDIRTITFENDI
jgi:hypothetical protein